MIERLLKEYRQLIDKKLEEVFPACCEEYSSVVEAARYSLEAGGKRIRPAIMLEFYRLCGGTGNGAIDFAAALEMIHTYSLIHDDLPCMDDDDFRRGKPSCHKVYGEDIALLAGDGLLTAAFYTASKTCGVKSEYVLKAMAVLADCAGINGMIGGQVIDLANEKGDPELDIIIKTYELKTSALIRAAAVIGCILAGADQKHTAAANEYGRCLGLAFQIIDDILDFTGDEKLLGKPVGSDLKNHKTTYVTKAGLETAKLKAAELSDAAVSALSAFEGDRSALIGITEYLLDRKY